MAQNPSSHTDDVRRLLTHAPLNVDGRLLEASNATLRCVIGEGDSSTLCVYKPQRGERPLWDFPSGTLTGREIAAYEIDRALGFDLIPPTVWREEGPAGPGMCQLWVAEDDDARLVDVVSPNDVVDGWIPVLRASDGAGNPVALVHADDPRLQQMAILDTIINNGDRKGGHVITDTGGRVWGVDHGVSLSCEPKLRTVLWGWARSPISDQHVAAVSALRDRVERGFVEIEEWISEAEIDALVLRIDELLTTEEFPTPSEDWPAIPWPVF